MGRAIFTCWLHFGRRSIHFDRRGVELGGKGDVNVNFMCVIWSFGRHMIDIEPGKCGGNIGDMMNPW